MKKIRALLLSCLFMVSMTGCDAVDAVVARAVIPETVTIEGVTYRSGFYGNLYPLFGEVGDIGSETLQKEIAYEDGARKFRRVSFKGHNWVHSYTGTFSSGTVYCAESEWEEACAFYADPANFEYYYGVGYSITEKSVRIPEIDVEKFDELLAFSRENDYMPFDTRSNNSVMTKTYRVPEAEFHEGVCFYKVSIDGYFATEKRMFFVHEGKLLFVFYHDVNDEEVVALDVPDELGQYFINLLERYPYDATDTTP